MARVLTVDGLDELVQELRRRGRTVVGPVVRDGVITHDEIDSAGQLPIGWTEDQEGGRYRLEPTGTGEMFASSTPSTSWKRYLYPERTLLIRSRRGDDGLEISQPEPERPEVAFFGVRSCDLAALGTLDRVFLDDEATDPTYDARRSGVFVVAVGCNHPGNTCFCVSMDTGPSPRAGYDLALTELYDSDRHVFLVDVGSDRGADVLAALDGREATDADRTDAGERHETAVGRMGRRLRSEDPPRAAEHLTHPRWDDVAERCLSCGNCTMVCPTCFCSTTEDSTALGGLEAERWRVWDSCFTLGFSQLGEGSVRSDVSSRYRQWLLHKLVTWHDQFGSSGCVGCGRCITWCPVGIDLTEEVAALATASPTGIGDPT